MALRFGDDAPLARTLQMRLFAAVPLAEPARSEVVRLLGALRAQDWPVRWVSDEVVHITLKFFGEVPEERLDVIAEALRLAATGADAMMLRLSSLGAFPTERRPRILWAGIESHPAFTALRERIENASDAIGFAREGVPFAPHVTLGRLREGQRLPAHALEAPAAAVSPQTFLADTLALYESILTPAGPHYQTRASIRLGQ
jgi:2'-5' RNA ligase